MIKIVKIWIGFVNFMNLEHLNTVTCNETNIYIEKSIFKNLNNSRNGTAIESIQSLLYVNRCIFLKIFNLTNDSDL